MSGAFQGLVSIALGLGLAAACGFRVFVPLLIASATARLGHLHLAGGFDWLASTGALIALASATVLEIAAYYVPWLDHALDMVATPAAVLAGMLASASVLVDLPPALKWAVTIIGGGGIAALIQGTSVLLRLKSTALTGGVANPVVATAELMGAVGVGLLAVLCRWQVSLRSSRWCLSRSGRQGGCCSGGPLPVSRQPSAVRPPSESR